MNCFPEGAGDRLIVDAVHGDIRLNEKEWQVIDTLPFQRLRRIKQLQMGQVTYPNATHTRFAHSLGTLAVMQRILDRISSNRHGRLERGKREDLRLAALLHDVGHYPYSHLMEGLDKVVLTEDLVSSQTRQPKKAHSGVYPGHEELGTEIISSRPEFANILGGKDRASRIGDLIARSSTADAQWSKLVHSSLDMDRLDYLRRDSQAAGVPYGMVDINYLLNSIQISPKGMLGVAEKALHAAEQYLLARFFMHKTVYFHKTTFGIEQACRQLLKRMKDSGYFEMPRSREDVLKLVLSEDLGGFTDDYVDRLVHEAATCSDSTMSNLARSIESRQPPKLLKEVQVLHDHNDGEHHAGSFFWTKAKSSLEKLAQDHEVPLGQFLLCKTKPVRLEPRGPLQTMQEAMSSPSERQDELIKVFVESEEEPRSLVDIKHSLAHLCGGHFWQSYRLYVVCNDEDKQQKVESLRATVANWDRTET